MAPDLDGALRQVVREEVAAAVREALQEIEPRQPGGEPEDWRERVWTAPEEVRLSLSEAAEALDCSERSVRRYLNGDGSRPALPHQRGPSGVSIKAGDLRSWIEECERAARFAGGGR